MKSSMRIRRMLNVVTVSLLFISLLQLTSCKKNEAVSPTPKIEALADADGAPGVTTASAGASLTIKGSNFSPVPSENIVKFNGTLANVTASTTTELTTTVPEEATTGKISITVNGVTSVSATDFVINTSSPVPIINSFNPSTGFAPRDGGQGTMVYINGAAFNAPEVKFNGTPARVVSSSATTIIVTVPIGATPGKISVTSAGTTVLSTRDFMVRPMNESVISGWRSTCENFIIRGENFHMIPSMNEVKFNGVPAIVTASSFYELVTTLPANATSGPVTVTINGFTAMGPPIIIPEIRSFSPAAATAGAQVTLRGDNIGGFQYTDKKSNCHEVKFNGIRAELTFVSENEIIAIVPAGATTGKITISGNGRTSTSLIDFIVSVAPSISSFAPMAGTPGSQVTISGSDFVPNLLGNAVKFNGVRANVISASSSQVIVTVPTGATSGRISIDNVAGSAVSTSDFTINPLPPLEQITFEPFQGHSGTMVTINGTGFNPVREENRVYFGSPMGMAPVITASSTQLTVIVPATATSGRISVIVNNVTIMSGMDFHFIVPPPFVINVQPTSGVAQAPNVPGTRVVINGVNFSVLPFENVVRFGNVFAPVISSSPNRLEVIVPPGAVSGPITVTVNGMIAHNPEIQFTVLP
ncbi:MAG: hypothetical protein HOP08_17325 [Cyclobacteriaceae bacterium]|nr:hypothetical protein [Cyclobacteriaceae bacterium]